MWSTFWATCAVSSDDTAVKIVAAVMIGLAAGQLSHAKPHQQTVKQAMDAQKGQ
jgi:hypothetical protein